MLAYIRTGIKQILRAGGVLGICAVASSVVGNPEEATMTTAPAFAFYAMDPSVRRMPGTTEERLDTLKELGYDGLSSNDTSLEGISRLIPAAEARDMRVYALYLSCPLTTAGVTLPAHFDELCEVLGRHGAVLWIYMESKDYKPSSEEADPVAVPALRAAADRAAVHGVKIALYPHRYYWVETFADAIRVAEKVDRANLGVSFNLCHSLRAGEEERIPDLLREAGPRLFMVTINGADSGAAGAEWDRLIRPLGEGTYDPAPLLELLRKLGYQGAVGFQAFGIPDDAVVILRKSMDAWRKLNR